MTVLMWISGFRFFVKPWYFGCEDDRGGPPDPDSDPGSEPGNSNQCRSSRAQVRTLELMSLVKLFNSDGRVSDSQWSGALKHNNIAK